MENKPELASPEVNIEPAAGPLRGPVASAAVPAENSTGGFLSQIESMPHFGIPAEESFNSNFRKGGKGLFFCET